MHYETEEIETALEKRAWANRGPSTKFLNLILAISPYIVFALEAGVFGRHWGHAAQFSAAWTAILGILILERQVIRPKLREGLRRHTVPQFIAASEVAVEHYRRQDAFGRFMEPVTSWSAPRWLDWLDWHVHEVLSAARHGKVQFQVLPYGALSFLAQAGIMLVSFGLPDGLIASRALLVLIWILSVYNLNWPACEIAEYLREWIMHEKAACRMM